MTIQNIKQLTADYPKFEDGRIDYTNERVCFVLNCVVVSGSEVLLTERSSNVIAYPDTINGISGFIDRVDVSIEEQARTELSEELQAPLSQIERLEVHAPMIQVDQVINREWHVCVVLVEFRSKFRPETNWENKSAKWYKITEATELELMPGFDETLKVALAMRVV